MYLMAMPKVQDLLENRGCTENALLNIDLSQ